MNASLSVEAHADVARSVCDGLQKRGKGDEFFLRLWCKREGTDNQRIVRIFSFKTFTAKDKEGMLFLPKKDFFAEPVLVGCHAQLSFNYSYFRFEQVILQRETMESLGEALYNIPTPLLNLDSWIMVHGEYGLIRKERLVAAVPLMILQAQLSAMKISGDDDLELARGLFCRMLNETNAANWRELFSLMG